MISKIIAKDLGKISNFKSHLIFPNSEIEAIEFDSRDIIHPSKTLFICLKGQKSNGHLYIEKLIEKGVQNFVISEERFITSRANFFVVEDTLIGFQSIAASIRKNFQKPLIAITGSNGKTIIKEWLGQILSFKYKTYKSPKSYNSQIGVAYSLSHLGDHECALIETGISKKGEMETLHDIIQPNIGIFTNIGDAHSEGFQSLDEKIKEKSLLFKDSDKIVFCSDHLTISDYLTQNFNETKLISWGQHHGKYIFKYSRLNKNTQIEVNNYSFKVDWVDNASLENVSHCIVTAFEMGLNAESIQYALTYLQPVDMRFEIKEGARNNLIINDSYNNDLAGLKMTLDLAKKMNSQQKMILIASEFQQQEVSENWEKELNELLFNTQLSEIIWVGKRPKLWIDIQHFETTDQLLNHLESKKYENTFLIVKGARQFQFEKVVDFLEVKQHITRVEVNLSRLIQNYNYYKSQLKPHTKIMVMVKAFAYGSGIIEVSKLLEMNHVDYLAVAYTDEGVLLRKNGVKTPIMVMNVVLQDLEQLIDYQLEPEIYSLEQLEYFESKNKDLKYHIKLDTGMHRLGFDKNSIDALIHFLTLHPEIKIESVLTHLASTDNEKDDNYTLEQFHLFDSICKKIEESGHKDFDRHALNSAGIERFNNHQYDMVRLGIGIYGFGVDHHKVLKQVICLKTHVSQLRFLKKEETIGYNRKGKLERDSIIATIPIGYADGYDRRFSNGVGSVLINGVEAPVIGNVCMDMTMIDVTDVPCQAGDEVIIYNDQLNAEKQAKKIGTISYELLTHLSERVTRIYFFE